MSVLVRFCQLSISLELSGKKNLNCNNSSIILTSGHVHGSFFKLMIDVGGGTPGKTVLGSMKKLAEQAM